MINMSSLCNPLQGAPFTTSTGGDQAGVVLYLLPLSHPITNKKSSSISFLLPLLANVFIILIPLTYPLAISSVNPPFFSVFLLTIPGVPPPMGGGNSQNR